MYDALATDRPYRDGWEQSRILDYLIEGAGTEFSPTMVRSFVAMMSEMGDRIHMLGNAERAATADEALNA